jgi:hypothetical protein
MSTFPTFLKKNFQNLGHDWLPINISYPSFSKIRHSGFISIPIIRELFPKYFFQISKLPPFAIPISTNVIFLFF